MKMINSLFKSSIGRKWIMSITGLGAFTFLIVHLAENLLFFCGRDTLNKYAEWLHSLPFLPVLELGLASVFTLHIILSIIVTLQNRKARGSQKYLVSNNAGERTLMSQTMMISGAIVLIFILIHVWSMKWSQYSELLCYDRIIAIVTHPFFATVYSIGIFFVGFHLAHGIASAFQSLGLVCDSQRRSLKIFSTLFAALLSLGFFSIIINIWIKQ